MLAIPCIFLAAAQQLIAVPEHKVLVLSSSSGYLGGCVALDGSHALISDYGMPDLMLDYREQAGTWSLHSTVNMDFAALAIDGDWMIAGHPNYNLEGAAHALKRVGGAWQYFQFLPHPNWDNFSLELYGNAVDLDGERAAISNPTHNGPDTVHIWEYSATLAQWRVKHEITSALPGADAVNFGAGVALHGDELLVASRRNVQHFHYDAGLFEWQYQGTLVTGMSSGGLPRQLSWSATDVVAVSDPFDDDLAADSGAVYVIERIGGAWTLPIKLFPSSAQVSARFGWAVDVADGTVAVGVPWSNAAATQSGAVEFFARNDGWRHAGTVTAYDADANDTFGHSVSLGDGAAPLGQRLLTGAPTDDDPSSFDGSAYVYAIEHQGARVYCTAKRNSLGCVPRAGFSGTPSVTSASAFTISASNVLNQRPGVCFYSLNGRAAAPYKGGIKCFASPYRRAAGTLQSGGTPLGTDDCTGVLALDFNAWIQSGVDPSLFPGAVVNAQFFARDGAASFGLSLTEALEFEIEP